MGNITDSGERVTFQTGAVREISDEKGRCDLLPLDIIAHRTHDLIIAEISKYIREGQVDYLWLALDIFIERTTDSFWKSVLEVSIHYAEGANKYNDRNWEKGIPVHCYIDSALRHYIKYRDGWDDERHDRAFMWNIFGAIWTHINKPEMIDLPFRINKEI